MFHWDLRFIVVFEYCATLATVCYQRLPHPISGVLQKLSVLDGVDEDRLLVFLDLVLQLADFPGVSDEEVLSLSLIHICPCPIPQLIPWCSVWVESGLLDDAVQK